MNDNKDFEVSLAELIPAYLKKIWIPILCALLLAVIGFVYTSQFVTPMYSSSATLYILNRQSGAGVYSQSDLTASENLTKDSMHLIKTAAILDRVIETEGLEMTESQLSSMISVSNPEETRYLSVRVSHADPAEAKRIVDAVSLAAKNYVTENMNYEIVIVENGNLPTAPSSPSIPRNMFILAFMGFLIPSGIVILKYIIDDKLINAEQVELRLGLNVIGKIPYSDALEDSKKKMR